ncbi:unnamed protein product [Acanthoscelides obtectus]|nr:unnamed protein product [Acanthoscelides obtectus]CAK1638562.1 hypothetical protein AOBTE_LOCUS10666 [Acanthoscelides obtectus]
MLHLAYGTFSQPTSLIETEVSVPRPAKPGNMLIYVPEKVIRLKRQCCFETVCEEVPLGMDYHSTFKCYEKSVCGKKCDKNRGATGWYSDYNQVPQLIRRDFIDKFITHSQCVSYKFDCSVCPDPSRYRINIFDLSKDCVNCYYQGRV